jgi:protein phosphatase 1 regulatory subunit 42
MKLVDAAQQLLNSAAERGMHVSDSASSIGGTQQAMFAGGASIASQLQSMAQYGDKQPGRLEALLQQGVSDVVVQQLLGASGLAGLNLADPAAASLLLGLAGAGAPHDLWQGQAAALQQQQQQQAYAGAGSFGPGLQQQQLGGSLGMAELALQQQQQQLALQLAQLQAQAMGLPGAGAAQLLQAQLNQQALMRALMPPGAAGAAQQLLQHAQLSAQLAGAGAGFRPGQYMAGGGPPGGGPAQREQRGGRLSRRVTDPALEAERRSQQEKLFSLDADRIMSGEDKRTTLMVKNIPNKYTQKMLLASVEEHFKGMFDFFYLPIDFKNKCNVGYAFINIIKPAYIVAFVERFHNRK